MARSCSTPAGRHRRGRRADLLLSVAVGLAAALAASPVAALSLGGEEVSKERLVVFIVIGHSNALSNVDAQPVPGQTWNYIVPGKWGRAAGWERAQNPLHVSEYGTVGFSGPGKPLLQKLAAAHPGYHIGMLQNPNNRAAVTWIDPSPPDYIDPVWNRYCDGCGLYSELMSNALAIKPQVTFAGIIAMLGFMAAKDAATAASFAEDTQDMVAAMRRDLSLPDLPFLIDAGNFGGSNKFTYWETVRDQILLIPSLVPHSAIIDAGLTADDYFDGHHYNDTGHDKFAARAVEIIGEQGWFPLAPEPELALTPASLSFSGEVGGAAPDADLVEIANAGTGTLAAVETSVTYGGAGGWLAVSISGSGNAQTLSNQVSLSGLGKGSYSAQVQVDCANATNAPLTYTVSLIVDELLEVSAIEVSPALTELEVGGAAAFVAAARDQHGQPIAAAIQWSSSGGSFAPAQCSAPTLSCATTFTAGSSPGSVTLVASSGPVQTTAVVTVQPLPSITLLAPLGGEDWHAGASEQIAWTTEQLDSVVIYQSVNGGATWQTLEGLINDSDPRWGSYPWSVPNVATAQARIRLTGYYGESPVESGDFTIEAAPEAQSLELLAPSGGETFVAGDQTTVTWTGSGMDSVSLSLSTDAGTTWELLDSVETGDASWGGWPWTVPAVGSAHCLLRVESPGAVATATSGPFSIELVEADEPPPPAALEVTRVTLSGTLPAALSSATSITVDGAPVAVAGGAFEAAIAIPAGARSITVELAGVDLLGTRHARLLRVDLADAEPLIPGLAVSLRQLRAFVGGRGGVLVWVDEADAGKITVLDFRAESPQVQTLVAHERCVNPRLSPDGTRLVYSVGSPAGPKSIYALRLADQQTELLASGDVGYWHRSGGDDYVVYCDWSDGDDNGAGGSTYLLPLEAGGIAPSGAASAIHDRAMDAGASGDGTWLGQVYKLPYAYNAQAHEEYGPEAFVLMDGTPASGQTCNGSMAPVASGRMMTLTIPHDWVRIFDYDAQDDRFEETSRFELPAGMDEWEYPEWSTDAGFFTAVMQPGDLRYRLFLVKIAAGALTPEVLAVTLEGSDISYSHLYLEAP